MTRNFDGVVYAIGLVFAEDLNGSARDRKLGRTFHKKQATPSVTPRMVRNFDRGLPARFAKACHSLNKRRLCDCVRKFRRCRTRDRHALRGEDQSLRERIRVHPRPRHDVRQDYTANSIRSYGGARRVGQGWGRGAYRANTLYINSVTSMFSNNVLYVFLLGNPAFLPCFRFSIVGRRSFREHYGDCEYRKIQVSNIITITWTSQNEERRILAPVVKRRKKAH